MKEPRMMSKSEFNNKVSLFEYMHDKAPASIAMEEVNSLTVGASLYEYTEKIHYIS